MQCAEFIYEDIGGPIDCVYATAVFEEKSPLADLIHRYKYDFSREVAEVFVKLFGGIFGRLSAAEESAAIILVPVPLHRRRINFRGFNQSEVLAQKLSKKFGVKMANLLTRHRYTQPQVELSKEHRLTNLHGAFSLKNPAEKIDQNALYLLVDDVCTTGSTLGECAKVLKAAGANRVGGLVIAKAV